MPSRAPVHRFGAAQPKAERAAEYNRHRASSDYDRPWRRCRTAFMAQEPLCRACIKRGDVTAASEVHHIKPIWSHPELRLDWANLAPVCHSCHMKIEAGDTDRAAAVSVPPGVSSSRNA